MMRAQGTIRAAHRAAALVAALLSTPEASADPPELGLPLDCPSSGCIIQSFVDIDPGPGRRDHACGAATYDGHTGTDFRLPDLLQMAEGVRVRAAAAGVVTATRDGMPDRYHDRYHDRGKDTAVQGRGCGNGVVIGHGGGWTTQYCHLRQGSVRVREGDRLSAGDAIGLVGLSGRTEFPHLELIVRKGGRVVDPFAVTRQGPGADDGSGHPDCGTEDAAGLWSDSARSLLPYPDALIINTGFADAVPSLQEVDNRARTLSRVDVGTPALVAYGRAINLKTGDVLRVSLRDASGGVVAQGQSEPMPNPRAQQMQAAGIRRPDTGWVVDRYVAIIDVLRAGRTHRSTELAIGGP